MYIVQYIDNLTSWVALKHRAEAAILNNEYAEEKKNVCRNNKNL